MYCKELNLGRESGASILIKQSIESKKKKKIVAKLHADRLCCLSQSLLSSISESTILKSNQTSCCTCTRKFMREGLTSILEHH